MANIIHDFFNAKANLLRHFKCGDEYFVQSKLGFNWEITEEDGIFFLNYWENINNKSSCVIIKKNDQPQIFKTDDYTMIIAIDCIKIAFIFNNVLNSGNIIR
ncbi:hypothetical protein LJB89_04125 [Tyzzerella sp. OttesenSCG-928-J15]|nr:hypothetical protein [Tyzzerella sp. OttesenSCG-928-J15]